MTKPRKSRTSVKQRSKRKRGEKALRSAGRPEDILKQETAYGPRKARAPQGTAHGAPPSTHKLHHPMEIAAQHWMQALMLPWVGWTALGTMMLHWPVMHLRLGALQHSDESRSERGRTKTRVSSGRVALLPERL